MMNTSDFDFINPGRKSTAVEPREKVVRNGRGKCAAPLPAPRTPWLMANDGYRFLRIVENISQITCHRELFELLQSGEIQHFIPHQILISAWGDFDGPSLELDVISAIPGIRTGALNRCGIDGLLRDLYKRWLNHGQQPLLLASAMVERLEYPVCDCALHKFLQGVWSLLVHGVIDMRDGNVSLYLAFNASSIVNGHSVESFRLLVDPLITQIDVAFRRIAALNSPLLAEDRVSAANPRMLSLREEEILLLVSQGKTNGEISNILDISAFTVKNHIHRIMKKLDAANRTEAVVNYRQIGIQVQRKKPREKQLLTA